MKYPKHVMAIKPGYRWELADIMWGFCVWRLTYPCPAARIMTTRNLLPC